MMLPPQSSADGRLSLIQAIPASGPSTPALGTTVDRLRAELPPPRWSAAQPSKTTTSSPRSPPRRRSPSASCSALGFLLLLVAFQAPLLAAIGVLTNLLATGAAFGVAKLIFQDGHLTGLLGFESQGFLDAWGPIFFFAMIFAIAMDYTVFLLSSAREHWEESGDAKQAMIGGMAHSGRVILAAGAVMVAVFFTFALSGPLPPKEMGVILGIAVLLDTFLVRLTLLPVFLRLPGPRWYLPSWLDRVLPEVHFGHGGSIGASGTGETARPSRDRALSEGDLGPPGRGQEVGRKVRRTTPESNRFTSSSSIRIVPLSPSTWTFPAPQTSGFR